MKTHQYAIIEPGPWQGFELDALTWIDAQFKADEPTYVEIKRLVGPLFPERDFEHVSVQWVKGPSDMFVDDMGMLDRQPVNEPATLVYWTATMLRELEREGGIETEAEVPDRRADALRRAAYRLFDPSYVAPRIHGRAVIFSDRVWF